MSALHLRVDDVDGPPGPASTPVRKDPIWLGTSWKMTKTLAEAREWVDHVVREPLPDGVEAFVLPPLTALHVVLDALPEGSPLRVGAQNAHQDPDGAVTGEVSMHQVHDAGARIVEIGHSERREHLGETDEVVAAKVVAALAADLVPLVCVGEPWSVRESGGEHAYVGAQVRAALAGLAPTDLQRVLLAYEPVWAIGEDGHPATPGDVVDVLATIRTTVAALAPGARPRGVLYGGSVTPDNAPDLLRTDGLDGLFVGRAAWTPAGFTALLGLCADATAAYDRPPSTHEQRSR